MNEAANHTPTVAALMSTAYWGPVQYYSKLLHSTKILVEQHEHYLKQTYRNHCRIATTNGVLDLTIPIAKTHGEKMPIRDVRIDYSGRWQAHHWRAIVTAYRSSPFFDYYADDIRPFYERQETFLFDLNDKIFRVALELIGLRTDIEYTAQFAATPAGVDDYRYVITPKCSQRIIDHQFKPQTYYQVFATVHGFAPNLSILDLLCNEGPNALQVLTGSIL